MIEAKFDFDVLIEYEDIDEYELYFVFDLPEGKVKVKFPVDMYRHPDLQSWIHDEIINDNYYKTLEHYES